MGYFGNPEDAEVSVISVEDTKAAMEEIANGIQVDTAYSSAAITCLPLGDGLNVTTININAIPPAIYAMALVTAGVGDAQLIVAAPAALPAGGMTALTGIFDAWDKVKCESSQSTSERQEMALRQIGLTADIATSLGMPLQGNAGYFVVEVQRIVVLNKFTSRDDIEATVANQEQIFQFAVPDPQRAELIDFMVELMDMGIDWSTFSSGWNTQVPSATQIIMTGDGETIRMAQETATAKAAQRRTEAAEAKKAKTQTARAEKRETQTAVAASETEEAILALTQTAEAQPTVTATATAMPFEYAGSLAAPVENMQLILKTSDDQEIAYTVAESVQVTRDGVASGLGNLKKGDQITIKVDAMTNEIVEITATPAPEGGTPIAKLMLLLPVLLLIPLGMVIRGRSFGDPFVVKRVARD
jgi:uncharacterized protein YpuA (DUF1002 family)